MNNGYDLSGALAALEKQGFTPSLIMVERLFRYPDSQSTQNDHLGYWLRLVWERDGMVYEPQHLEKFLSHSDWRQSSKPTQAAISTWNLSVRSRRFPKGSICTTYALRSLSRYSPQR